MELSASSDLGGGSSHHYDEYEESELLIDTSILGKLLDDCREIAEIYENPEKRIKDTIAGLTYADRQNARNLDYLTDKHTEAMNYDYIEHVSTISRRSGKPRAPVGTIPLDNEYRIEIIDEIEDKFNKLHSLAELNQYSGDSRSFDLRSAQSIIDLMPRYFYSIQSGLALYSTADIRTLVSYEIAKRKIQRMQIDDFTFYCFIRFGDVPISIDKNFIMSCFDTFFYLIIANNIVIDNDSVMLMLFQEVFTKFLLEIIKSPKDKYDQLFRDAFKIVITYADHSNSSKSQDVIQSSNSQILEKLRTYVDKHMQLAKTAVANITQISQEVSQVQQMHDANQARVGEQMFAIITPSKIDKEKNDLIQKYCDAFSVIDTFLSVSSLEFAKMLMQKNKPQFKQELTMYALNSLAHVRKNINDDFVLGILNNLLVEDKIEYYLKSQYFPESFSVDNYIVKLFNSLTVGFLDEEIYKTTPRKSRNAIRNSCKHAIAAEIRLVIQNFYIQFEAPVVVPAPAPGGGGGWGFGNHLGAASSYLGSGVGAASSYLRSSVGAASSYLGSGVRAIGSYIPLGGGGGIPIAGSGDEPSGSSMNNDDSDGDDDNGDGDGDGTNSSRFGDIPSAINAGSGSSMVSGFGASGRRNLKQAKVEDTIPFPQPGEKSIKDYKTSKWITVPDWTPVKTTIKYIIDNKSNIGNHRSVAEQIIREYDGKDKELNNSIIELKKIFIIDFIESIPDKKMSTERKTNLKTRIQSQRQRTQAEIDRINRFVDAFFENIENEIASAKEARRIRLILELDREMGIDMSPNLFDEPRVASRRGGKPPRKTKKRRNPKKSRKLMSRRQKYSRRK